MHYDWTAVPDSAVPRAENPVFQHLLDTYVSETNKVASVWRVLQDTDLDFKPHPRFTSVGDILRHQLLSERRFFGEFVGTPEPAPDKVVPAQFTVESALNRFVELAVARLPFFARQAEPWWMEVVPFFDVRRQRIWIVWRRVLHTAHHRTQLTVVLKLLDRKVPSTYGPTADVKWEGADPTYSVAAAGRK
jgi:uncharacterized damage-inducible protein DinB